MTSTSAAHRRTLETTSTIPSPGAGNRAKRIDEIMRFVDTQRMRRKYTPGWFEDVETELHQKVLELERDLTAEIMAAHDVDAGAIEIAGKAHRRVLRAAQTYVTKAGPVVVERWLYRDRTDDEATSVSPMERRLGIVGGFWTPKAAKTALWVVAQMTPQKAEELFARVGGMAPSKSSLDRLPKLISERWEHDREAHEAALRDALIIPEGTVSVAVSLDGVLAPIDGGNSPVDVRNAAANEGRTSKGPAGYREVGCATLSFCDAQGDLLGAVRMARTPERNKRTLKASLAAELLAVLRKAPNLTIVKVADGVDDNWTFLSRELPAGEEVLDFFHASEHLHAAVAAAYGDGTRDTRHRFEELRDSLRDDDDGVARVIRAVDYLRKKFPHRDKIRQCAAYFRKHRGRMNYAALVERGLPIGSGVVEAACKTLVAQRLKLSGMRWGHGALAILTARGWDQSERFDEAWALLAAEHHVDVHVLANVIPFMPPKAKRPARSRAKAAG
jgi:hypothetical protein